MSEQIGFSRILTKSMTVITPDQLINKDVNITKNDRLVEGILTAEVLDKQDEITVRDSLSKAMPIWMKRGAPLSDQHTNRIIGKGLSFENVEIDDHGTLIAGLKIQALVYKDNPVDDLVWSHVLSKRYKGFSYGGITRTAKMPVKKEDGTMSYKLSDIDVLEVALCPNPSCPLAVITDFNSLAKSYTVDELSAMNAEVRKIDNVDHVVVKCDKNICFVEKSSRIMLNKPIGEEDVSKMVDDQDKDKKDEKMEEMEKSIGHLEKTLAKATELISKTMDVQNDATERTEKLLAKLTDKVAKMEEDAPKDDPPAKEESKDDDDKSKDDPPAKDEDKKDEEVSKKDDSKGMKATNNSTVVLPDDDNESHKTTIGETPSGTAQGDKITIAKKDSIAINDLRKKYPHLFTQGTSVQKSADDGQKAWTPHFNDIVKGADDIIKNSALENEFAALMKAGGTPDSLKVLTKQMGTGGYGVMEDVGYDKVGVKI